MPQIKPSIAKCFEIYRECTTPGLDPLTEEEQRIAFYCGFEACMQAIDAIAEITDKSEGAGLEAWESLQAEFDKFATENESGEISTIH